MPITNPTKLNREDPNGKLGAPAIEITKPA